MEEDNIGLLDGVENKQIFKKLTRQKHFAHEATPRKGNSRRIKIKRYLNEVFTPIEEKILEVLNNEYEGKTEKQKNPYKKKTLAWAYWILGRAGGWKGYTSEGPAGPTTIKEGLDELSALVKAVDILKNVCIS